MQKNHQQTQNIDAKEKKLCKNSNKKNKSNNHNNVYPESNSLNAIDEPTTQLLLLTFLSSSFLTPHKNHNNQISTHLVQMRTLQLIIEHQQIVYWSSLAHTHTNGIIKDFLI